MTEPKAFRSDIEGLRGIAVLLVVLFHAGMPGFSCGFVGVDIFFVLSGFLISRGLLKEANAGRVDLAQFWARRIRRLLPSAGVVIAAVTIGAFALLSPLQWRTTGREAIASTFYVENLFLMLRTNSYWDGRDELLAFLHMWSLGVEEQYYVATPFVFAAIPPVARRIGVTATNVALGLALAVVAVSFVASCTLPLSTSFYLLPTRAWELAIGAVVAACEPQIRQWSKSTATGVAVAGAIALAACFVFIDGATLFPGPIAVLPVGAAALLVAAGCASQTVVGDALGNPLLRWLGRLSYCWYLWHWPALKFAEGMPPGPPHIAIAVLISLGLAWLTHLAVEQPLLHHPALRARTGLNYALAAGSMTVTAACGLVLVVLAGQKSAELAPLAAARADNSGTPDPCNAIDASQPYPEVCVSGAAEGPWVLVLGDSHAAHWVPAIDELGKQRGFRVLYSGKSACSADLVRTAYLHEPPDPICVRWQESLDELVPAVAPALVIASSADSSYLDGSYFDQQGRKIRGDLSPERALGAKRLLAAVGDVPLVWISDTPDFGFNLHDCLALNPGDPHACSVSRSASTIETSRAGTVRAEAGMRVIDGAAVAFPTDLVEPVNGTTPRFRDRAHMTRTFARSLARPLGEALDATVTVPGTRE